jgi:hypothetical protein
MLHPRLERLHALLRIDGWQTAQLIAAHRHGSATIDPIVV